MATKSKNKKKAPGKSYLLTKPKASAANEETATVSNNETNKQNISIENSISSVIKKDDTNITDIPQPTSSEVENEKKGLLESSNSEETDKKDIKEDEQSETDSLGEDKLETVTNEPITPVSNKYLLTTPKSDNNTKVDPYPIVKELLKEEIKQFEISETSKTSYTAIGTTGVAVVSSGVALYHSCADQLGLALGFTNALGNAKLVQSILYQNLPTFLSMNQDSLQRISGVGNRIDNLMGFFKPFVEKVVITEKSINSVTNLAKTLHDPTQNNLIKLAVDAVDLVGFASQSQYSAIVPLGHAVYLTYQGEPIQALGQAAMASSYLLPIIMTPANPLSLAIISTVGIATTYNFYTGLNNFMNDQGSINSMVAYKEICQTLSTILPESVYNFANKAADYKTSINHAKMEVEKANLENFIDHENDFTAKLKKYIYTPLIEKKHELLDQVAQGKITQEQAENYETKHFVIELEYRSYDHCIEIKDDLYVEEKNYYHCYINDTQIIEQVIIGENNNLESVKALI